MDWFSHLMNLFIIIELFFLTISLLEPLDWLSCWEVYGSYQDIIMIPREKSMVVDRDWL